MRRRGRSLLLGALALGSVAAACPVAPALAEAPRIRYIHVETRNVFEERESSTFSGIANALHGVTREQVVRRELLFAEGDMLEEEKLAETERRLRAFRSFRSVEIRTEPVGVDEVDVVVVTRDAWTTELSGSLGRAGGSSRAAVHLEENNLFGTGKQLSLGLATGPDRDTREIAFADPQFLGRRLALELLYGSNTDGERRRFALERPFRSLADSWSAALRIEQGTRETRIYRHGKEAARWEVDARAVELFMARRLSSAEAREVTRLYAGYRREDAAFAPTADAPESEPLPEERRFGYFFTRLELLVPDFVVARDVERFSRTEDFDLGLAASLEVGYSPGLIGARDALEGRLEISRGLRITGGFLRGSLSASSRARDGTLEHALLESELLAVWRPGEGSMHTLVGRARVGAGSRLDRDVQLTADGGTGLRGYRLHAFTGDRRLLLNLEDRIVLTGELLNLFQLGAAVFVDAGYAWPKGSPFDFSDLRTDVGIGLRLGLPRAARHSLLRVDLAYPLRPDPGGRRGWLLSFSSSQAF